MEDNLCIIMQWYSKDLKDLHPNALPLPNTAQFPYLDKLKQNAKLAPTVLLYTKKGLSERQIEVFESLTEIADSSKLFVIAYEDIRDNLEYDYILKKFENDTNEFINEPTNVFSSWPVNWREKFASIIDLQRLVILNGKSALESYVEEKFGFKLPQKMLYVDFDRDPTPLMENIKAKNLDNVAFPLSISIDNFCICAQIENNAIACRKSGEFSNALQQIGEEYSKGLNEMLYMGGVFGVMSKDFYKNVVLPYIADHFFSCDIKDWVKITSSYLEINCPITSSYAKVAQEKIRNFLDKFSLGKNLEGTKDQSWAKNISKAITESMGIETKIIESQIEQRSSKNLLER